MRKIYALMIGGQVIKKSNKYSDLIESRESLKEKRAYICIWLGRINFRKNTGKISGNEEKDIPSDMSLSRM